jgi:cellulose synthase/poly-beta-1,6-N-acetylglucosamine synthase-like glycosyltransferase
MIGVFGKGFDYKKHKEVTRDPSPMVASVDIYLPSAGEPLEILENTYQHVVKMTGNYIGHVLDDSGREQVKILAEKYGFNYICRPNRGELKKAGNMRYAFPLTNGEFIAIFDADFCPSPNFLRETLPYFFHDSKIAIVQTPQYFEITPEQTWVEKGASYVQELFYRLIQVNRDSYGGSICVGSNAVYRRSSLEPFGGTAAIGYSEDVHTGFNVLSLGWKIRYIPICLAKGVCPDRVASYFIQQYRWAMGSISLFLNPFFWKTKLTVMQRVCYLSGMFYYITTGVGIFVSVLPSLILIIFVPEKLLWYNAFFSIPSFIFGTCLMAYWTKAPFGWYAIQCRQISYYAHLFALVDKLRGNLVSWVPSGVTTNVGRFNTFKEILFWWNLVVLFLVAFFIGWRADDYAWYNFLALGFFTIYNFIVNYSILKDQP